MRESDAAAFLDAFRRNPATSALFLDFDGTLSEIAATPEGARLHPDARRELERLARVFPLYVVSGRPVDELGCLLGFPGISLVGLHGLEWREGEGRGIFPGAEPYLEVMLSARRSLKSLGFDSLPGAIMEDKGLILALHFRSRPESGPEVERMASEAAGLYQLGLHRGRQVIELRPPLAFGKGKVVVSLVKRHGFKRSLYAGDDLTDAEAFRSLKELEGEGFSSLAVAVLSEETPGELLQGCDLEVNGVDGVIALLGLL